MAEPTDFEESDCVLDKPEDMEREDCHPLCIKRVMYQLNDTTAVISVLSCFKFTKEELEEINKTGRVWVLILGQTQPPIIIFGKKPI